MTETILANAMLVLPGEAMRGQIRMVDGHIADLAEGPSVPPSSRTMPNWRAWASPRCSTPFAWGRC